MTGRRVQVTEFGVRGDAAAAGAHGDERAVAALAPGADAVEGGGRLRLDRRLGGGDVAGGEGGLAGEAGAGVERAVRARSSGRACDGSRTAPCARRRWSGSRASSSPRAGSPSSRRRSGRSRTGSRPSRRPAPAMVMHAPPSGAPSAATAVSGMMPLMRDGLAGATGAVGTAAAGAAPPMTGLKFTLASLGREVLPGEEVEQRRVAVGVVGVEVAADRDRALAGDGADVGDDLVEGALAAAQRPLAIVRRLVAVERDLGAGEAVGQQPVDDLGGEQEAVGDDADASAARRAPWPRHGRARRGSRRPAG